MDDLLENAMRDVEELTASVDFDTSEISEEEFAALPSLDDGTEEEDGPNVAVGTSPEEPDASTATVAVAARPSEADRGPAWLDAALTAINRPLDSLAPPARRWIRLIAAATLATALLFAILRPLLFARYEVADALRASVQRVTQDDPLDD